MIYREILLQELENVSDEVLAEAIDFIRFLKTKSVLNPPTEIEPSNPVENPNSEQFDDPKTAFSTFLAHLKQPSL